MRIGFCGKSGSGKTAAAEMIRERYGATILSFASPLKSVVSQLYPAAGASERRQRHQEIGALLRSYDSTIWVANLLRRLGDSPDAVVDDVRYPNEVVALQDCGFTIIRIIRPPGPWSLMGEEAVHESETALDAYPIPITCPNNGTLLALQDAVIHTVAQSHLAPYEVPRA